MFLLGFSRDVPHDCWVFDVDDIVVCFSCPLFACEVVVLHVSSGCCERASCSLWLKF